MEILFYLIGVSLFIALIFLALFIWSVKSGQYEDDYTPSVRMLFDDNKPSENKKSEIKTKSELIGKNKTNYGKI